MRRRAFCGQLPCRGRPYPLHVEITSFASDRLQQKINEYNQKKGLTGKAQPSTRASFLSWGLKRRGAIHRALFPLLTVRHPVHNDYRDSQKGRRA